MRLPTLLVTVCLLTVAGVGHTQQPPPLLPEPRPIPPIPELLSGIPPVQPPVPTAKLAEPTVDQMLDVLEALRV